MAQRRTTAKRRRALVEDLRKACREGELRPGDLLPTMRELQEKYGLSPRTVSIELKKLSDEGLLRTVPRVGIYVADPVGAHDHVFLMITPSRGMRSWVPHTDLVRLGFEERTTELGGSSLIMSIDAAIRNGGGTLPPVAGIFIASADLDVDVSPITTSTGPPQVRLSPGLDPGTGDAVVDTVYMDNVEGGRQATRHLFQHGHRRIAYLGLHSTSSSRPIYGWSALREQGWREVMERFGEPVDRMLFQPGTTPSGWEDEVRAATEAGAPIVARRDVTAVVCANDHAVMGLLTALREADVPPEAWPSVVGFDAMAEVDNHLLTSMRLPWEHMGRKAAELLHERANGRIDGPARHYELPMLLVSRMGPRMNWSGAAIEGLFLS